jgi:hypothetical protein
MNPGVIFPETVPKMDYIITANTSAGERPYDGLDPG